MSDVDPIRPVVALAAAKLLLHTFLNSRYGFHRDELATLDDARHLDWATSLIPR